jgi:hypothetical protein
MPACKTPIILLSGPTRCKRILSGWRSGIAVCNPGPGTGTQLVSRLPLRPSRPLDETRPKSTAPPPRAVRAGVTRKAKPTPARQGQPTPRPTTGPDRPPVGRKALRSGRAGSDRTGRAGERFGRVAGPGPGRSARQSGQLAGRRPGVVPSIDCHVSHTLPHPEAGNVWSPVAIYGDRLPSLRAPAGPQEHADPLPDPSRNDSAPRRDRARFTVRIANPASRAAASISSAETVRPRAGGADRDPGDPVAKRPGRDAVDRHLPGDVRRRATV